MDSVLQRWEGVVTEINAAFFRAEMCEVDPPSKDKVDGEIPVALVHPGDLELFDLGALFYLTVGQTKGEITVDLRFRRLVWSQKDVDEMEVRRKEWKELLR